MRKEIENYRGFVICFDTEAENFYTSSDNWDVQNTKRSYSSVKKWIDDFIKENNQFKPVFIERPESMYHSFKRVKLVGIRKDGIFYYENEKGEKEQLSKFNEKDYIVSLEENEPIYKEIAEIEKQREILRLKIVEIYKKLNRKSLNEIKSLYL